jgi:prepilin-type processing-associated H-X9-DG protein
MTQSKRQHGQDTGGRLSRSAFTLTEVLVAIFTLALLAALLMPALAKARSQAQGLVCRARLRQLVLANIGYATENDGFYVPAASDMWNDSGLHRWHGLRTCRNEPFDPTRGPLAAYIAEGGVKECPTRVPFSQSKDWNSSFERGCGGYGYNMAYLGSRLWDANVEFKQAYARTTSAHEVANPGQTVMFADTAMANGGDSLIEYSFAEPPFTVYAGQVMTDFYMSPSLHFRHQDRTNVGWTDGHVGSETMAQFDGTNTYGAHSSAFELGWFEPADNTPFDLR